MIQGPSFQPINEWLRQVGRLEGKIRKQLAAHPNLTFAATVAHLCSAIRKLAAVATDAEAVQPLARGVRRTRPFEQYMRLC